MPRDYDFYLHKRYEDLFIAHIPPKAPLLKPQETRKKISINFTQNPKYLPDLRLTKISSPILKGRPSMTHITTDYEFDPPSPVLKYRQSLEAKFSMRSQSSQFPETELTPRDLNYYAKKNKEYRRNMDRFNLKVESVKVSDGTD